MNNKLTENNETLGVVIKPIFTIKQRVYSRIRKKITIQKNIKILVNKKSKK